MSAADSGREGVQEYRSAVAKWLRQAMRGTSGRDDPLIKEVAKQSGVSRTTIWRVLNSEADADPDTLQRLAAALGVRAPRVQMVLRVNEADRPKMPPVAKLKEAAALVLEAAAELDVKPDVAAAKAAHRVAEKQAADLSRKKHRPA